MKRKMVLFPMLLGAGLALGAARAPAQHARPMEMPAPSFQLEGDSLVVPMASWEDRSVVQVTLDGHGPFPFVLDTGAGGSVVSKALVDSLGFAVAGEVQVGSPLGEKPVPAKLVRIPRVSLGGRLTTDLTCVAMDLPMSGPATHWGVLSPNQFPGLLVTWDFPGNRVVFRPGALPPPDGVRVFSYAGEMLPTISADVAGRRVRLHVDTGASASLMLPASLRDSLPLAGPPQKGRTARTVDRTVKLLDAKLAGRVVVAGRSFTDPALVLNPAARIGLVGSGLLREFEVTLDAQQRSVRLLTPGATGPGVGVLPARPPAPPKERPGAAELAAIAPGLAHAMIPLPGLATAGMPGKDDFAALARAGYRTVVDLCMPGEPRGFDEPQAVRAAGLEYVAIPFTRSTLGAPQIDEFRRVMRDTARRPVLVHCVAANRVGGILLPYLVLDRGMSEEAALTLAREIGLRSPEMEAAGREYVKSHRGGTD